MIPDRLSPAEVADRLDIRPATWRSWVSRGKAPPPDGRIGRTPWWRPATVEQWQHARPRKGQA